MRTPFPRSAARAAAGLLLLSMLAGCGGKPETTPSPSATTAATDPAAQAELDTVHIAVLEEE